MSLSEVCSAIITQKRQVRYRKLEELLGRKVRLTKFNCAVKMGVVLIHSLEVVDKYEG